MGIQYGLTSSKFVIAVFKDDNNTIVGVRCHDMNTCETVDIKIQKLYEVLSNSKMNNISLENGKLVWIGASSRYPTIYKSGKTENISTATVLMVYECPNKNYYRLVNYEGKQIIVDEASAIAHGKKFGLSNAKVVTGESKIDYIAAISGQLQTIRDVDKVTYEDIGDGSLTITLPKHMKFEEFTLSEYEASCDFRRINHLQFYPLEVCQDIKKLYIKGPLSRLASYGNRLAGIEGLPNLEELYCDDIISFGLNALFACKKIRKIEALGIKDIESNAFFKTNLQEIKQVLRCTEMIDLSAFFYTGITMQTILDLYPMSVIASILSIVTNKGVHIKCEENLVVHSRTRATIDPLILNKSVKTIVYEGYGLEIANLIIEPELEYSSVGSRDTYRSKMNSYKDLIRRAHKNRQTVKVSVPYLYDKIPSKVYKQSLTSTVYELRLYAGYNEDTNVYLEIRPQTSQEESWERFIGKVNLMCESGEFGYTISSSEHLYWIIKSLNKNELMPIVDQYILSIYRQTYNTKLLVGPFSIYLGFRFPNKTGMSLSRRQNSEIINTPGYLVLKTLNESYIVPTTPNSLVDYIDAISNMFCIVDPKQKKWQNMDGITKSLLVYRGRATVESVNYDKINKQYTVKTNRHLEMPTLFIECK